MCAFSFLCIYDATTFLFCLHDLLHLNVSPFTVDFQVGVSYVQLTTASLHVLYVPPNHSRRCMHSNNCLYNKQVIKGDIIISYAEMHICLKRCDLTSKLDSCWIECTQATAVCLVAQIYGIVAPNVFSQRILHQC